MGLLSCRCGRAGFGRSGGSFPTFPPHGIPVYPQAEREVIQEVIGHARPTGRGKNPWLELFRYKEVWGLVIAKFMTDAVWYFILFWLPQFLQKEREFNIKEVGYFAWIPFAAAGLGCLVVGYFSSWLVKRGLSLNLARKIAMGVSVAVMPCLFFATIVSTAWVIVAFAIAYFGQQAWSTLVMTLPADIFPRRVVGAVAGLVGFGGAMGGIVFNEMAGQMLKHKLGYGPIFAIAGTLHVLAFLLVLVSIRKVQALGSDGKAPVTVTAHVPPENTPA